MEWEIEFSIVCEMDLFWTTCTAKGDANYQNATLLSAKNTVNSCVNCQLTSINDIVYYFSAKDN